MKLRLALFILTFGFFCVTNFHSSAADPLVSFDPLGLAETAKRLDELAQNSISSGDAALARQLRVLSTTIKEVISQTEMAFERQSKSTLDGTDVVLANNISALANTADKVVGKSSDEVSKIIYQTQESINQILSRIPFMKNEPFVFAARTVGVPGSDPNRIELIGYGFGLQGFDADVRINKVDIAPTNFVIADGKAIINLTPEIISAAKGSSKIDCGDTEQYLVDLSCN